MRPTAAMYTWTITPRKNSGSLATSTSHGFGATKAAAGDPITAANHGTGKPAQCNIGDGPAMERVRQQLMAISTGTNSSAKNTGSLNSSSSHGSIALECPGGGEDSDDCCSPLIPGGVHLVLLAG